MTMTTPAPERRGTRTRGGARPGLAPERHVGPFRTPLHQPTRGTREERGRQLVERRRRAGFARLSVWAIGLLLAGVACAMGLSAAVTQQTFTLQELDAQEQSLDNRIESLNRDVERARSTSELTRRAADDGLVAPAEPGILEVGENGEIEERRAPGDGKLSIVDLNEDHAAAAGEEPGDRDEPAAPAGEDGDEPEGRAARGDDEDDNDADGEDSTAGLAPYPASR